jgi:hypothetical protein
VRGGLKENYWNKSISSHSSLTLKIWITISFNIRKFNELYFL